MTGVENWRRSEEAMTAKTHHVITTNDLEESGEPFAVGITLQMKTVGIHTWLRGRRITRLLLLHAGQGFLQQIGSRVSRRIQTENLFARRL